MLIRGRTGAKSDVCDFLVVGTAMVSATMCNSMDALLLCKLAVAFAQFLGDRL